MQVSFLGPFEVDGTEGPVLLGGPKERTLLALLALRANQVVSIAHLIEGLWGADPPATAVKTVHGNVARIRRALEAAGLGDVLVTKEPGYFFRVDPECIDGVGFERHAQAGRLALEAGDVETAERELAAGLGLWRGEALSNCREGSEMVAAEAVRWDELRLSAIEDRMEVQLARGSHAAIVGELEALLVRHPFRERLWHALMLALYRSRRQAEALRVYQRARHALVEDLGVEPSSELRALEGAILRADPSLDAVPPERVFGSRLRSTPDSSSARLLGWATGGPAFVGRARELALVDRLWRRACADERQVLLIGGEPGIGKTRLAAEACVLARNEGARVLYGRCDEGLGVPYQPFVETLRAYIESCTDSELEPTLGRYPGELVRLVPELATRVGPFEAPLQSDPATEQYRLFEAVVGWLGAAAEHRPCAIVLDDLHWAAPPTVLLLRHVIRSGRFDRALIMGTYRQSDLVASHPLAEMLADIHMSAPAPVLERLELSGLDASAVESFVQTASGRALGEHGRQFAQTVHRETGGNPFFVGEIVHNVMEQGEAVAPPADSATAAGLRWPTDLQIPPAARDVVVRRVARLSEDAQHVLTIAAVAGAEFDVAVLEQIVDVDLDALLGALEEAQGARVVDEVGSDRFAFAHAIARSALYDRLSVSRRLRLHGRVADALELVYASDRSAHLSELAFHHAEANSPDAVRYAVEAAAGALDRLAFEDAISICMRGLAAVERNRSTSDAVAAIDECDLLLTLGRAELRAGLHAGRATLLRAAELARSLGDGSRQSASVLAVNRGFFSRIGRIDTALVTALEHALEAQGPGDTRERAELLATLGSELVWSPDDRRFELSDLALDTARRVGDPRTLARVLLLRCMTIQAPDTRDERSALLRELRALSESLGDPASTFDSAFAYSGPAWETGDVAGMNEMEELATALAAELRQPRLEWQASFMRAARRLYEGDLDRAEQTAEETLALGQRAGQHGEAFIFYNEQILEIRRWQARLGELLDIVASLAGNAAVDFGFSLTRYAYDAGEIDVARRVYTEQMVTMALPPRRDMLALTVLDNLAYLAARFGDVTQAEVTYRALLPHACAFTSTTVAKPVGEHFLGMLATTIGDHPVAEQHFRNATRAHERARAPLLLAETHLEHARLLVASGAPADEVVDLLESARAIARPRAAAFLLLGSDEVEDTVRG